SLGDPVTMRFEVTGSGNFKTLGAPIFAVPQTGFWKEYEASKTLEDESDSDGFNASKAVFSKVVIPEAKVDTIPPFELAFFDPEKEEYVVLRTDPVPVVVRDDANSRSPAAPAALSSP